MVRRIFRDSAIYTGAAAFSQVLAFLLFPFLAHALRPQEYGTIDIVILLTTLAMLTVALEISQGLGPFAARLSDADERGAYASTVLVWSMISYTVLAAVALPLAGPLTRVLLGPDVDVWVFRTAIGWIWCAGALYVVQEQLRWQRRSHAAAILTVLTAVVSTSATAVYVFALQAGAVGFVAGQMTGAAVGLLAGVALSHGIYRPLLDRTKARTMLRYSIPLVPSSIGVLLNGYADRLAIQHEESLAAVGVYGIGFRVSLVMSLLIVGVQGAILPHVLANQNDPRTAVDLARVFRLFWAAGCVTFVVLSVFAEPLVALLAAPAYFGGAYVVPFLAAATFLGGLYAFMPGPAVTRRTRAFVLCNVGAGLLNLGLAFALVPGLGIRGAGLATVVSSVFIFASVMAVSHRLYPVPHDWRRLIAAAAAVTAIVVAARTVVVTGRATALQADVLLARLGICVIACVVVAALLVDRVEIGTLRLLLSSWAGHPGKSRHNSSGGSEVTAE